MTSFATKVLAAVRKIRRGRTATYKEIAQLAGNPRAYRAVGNILNKNRDPKVPCHRVIRSDLNPGGYNRGVDKKVKLLKKEKAI
ncbi:MAG: MGMT family protein [Candidatus Liptonbacteria bacterium]|nr:MGMT family protein [Candidatus Liptonbacteria bacterium]